MSEETNTITLTKGSINSGSLTIKSGGQEKNYAIKDGNIFEKDSEGKVTSTIAGTVDSQGKITMNDKLAVNSTIKADYTQKYLDFNIKTYTADGEKLENFLIQGSDSLNSVINKVNGSDVGVNMFYDSFSDQMTLTRTETGNFNKTGNEIVTTGNFINLGLRFGAELNPVVKMLFLK